MKIEFTTSYGQFSLDDSYLVKKKNKKIKKAEQLLSFFSIMN
jgi:hypothetical protein